MSERAVTHSTRPEEGEGLITVHHTRLYLIPTHHSTILLWGLVREREGCAEGERDGGREGGMDGWRDEGGMEGWMVGGMDGWMEGWREGGRDGWMEG